VLLLDLNLNDLASENAELLALLPAKPMDFKLPAARVIMVGMYYNLIYSIFMPPTFKLD